MFGSAGTMPIVALDENRGDDVVSRAHITEQIRAQIGVPRLLPKVMMSIDDR